MNYNPHRFKMETVNTAYSIERGNLFDASWQENYNKTLTVIGDSLQESGFIKQQSRERLIEMMPLEKIVQDYRTAFTLSDMELNKLFGYLKQALVVRAMEACVDISINNIKNGSRITTFKRIFSERRRLIKTWSQLQNSCEKNLELSKSELTRDLCAKLTFTASTAEEAIDQSINSAVIAIL